MDTTDDEFYYQKSFWKKLQQLKYDIIYLTQHFKRCVTILRAIKYAMVVLTALSVAALTAWFSIEWVRFLCLFASIICQVISALSEYFPFETRKSEIREMVGKLDVMYNEAESFWREIANGEIPICDIRTQMAVFMKREQEIQSNYLKNDVLPEIEKIVTIATNKTIDYFENLI